MISATTLAPWRRTGLPATALAAALACGGADAASLRFKLVDLGADTAAYAVDAGGNVAGTVGPHPAVYHDGAWTQLDPQGNGAASDIDRQGGVVYSSTRSDGVFRSWLRVRGGAPQLITVPGVTDSVGVRGVAADGAATGSYGDGTGTTCFVWQAGQAQVMPSMGPNCDALAINEAHQVVGGMSTAFDYEGFLWQDGNFTLLNTFGGTYSYAVGINRAGHAVGAATTDAGTMRPAYWGPFGLIDIGTPNGAIEGAAKALNDHEVIVGSYFDWTEHAFISHGVRTEDLSSFVVDLKDLFLVDATGINNAGVIVGNATAGDGQHHAYMLVPVGR